MKQQNGLPRGSQVTAGVLGLFGLMTLVASASIIFNIGGMGEEAGHYVPVVVWMNFFASILYLIATYGFIFRQAWTPTILAIALILMAIAAIGFYFHVRSGGEYEPRTIGALVFRIFVTAMLYAAARYYVRTLPPK
ncbi:MAG: hypothetical protein WBB32_13185 [Flavobacteriales bacterium]|nr:hypothetical protein [Flavobacteriales bacterium]